MMGTAIGVLVPAGLLAVPGMAGAAPAQPAASAQRAVRYVSPTAPGSSDTSCASAAYKTISEALKGVPAGSTVVACPGTYHEDVAVSTDVDLTGVGATIDATGKTNGILVTASGAVVQGFTVRNAIGEGILAQGAPGKPLTHVQIRDDVVTGNDVGATGSAGAGYKECQAQGQVPGDCGEGLHLMTVADSTVIGNTVTGNSGGILLTDELGPTDHNTIADNVVTNNVADCGVTIAGHGTKGFVKGKLVPSAGGIYDNRVVDNVIAGNGTKGAGAGVIIGLPAPGSAVYNNLIYGNEILGNGQPGVTLHSHAPGQDASGNKVVHNLIGTNNTGGDPDFKPADTSTTGVLVRTAASPVSITVSANTITGDAVGVWASPSVKVSGLSSNRFESVATKVHRG